MKNETRQWGAIIPLIISIILSGIFSIIPVFFDAYGFNGTQCWFMNSLDMSAIKWMLISIYGPVFICILYSTFCAVFVVGWAAKARKIVSSVKNRLTLSRGSSVGGLKMSSRKAGGRSGGEGFASNGIFSGTDKDYGGGGGGGGARSVLSALLSASSHPQPTASQPEICASIPMQIIGHTPLPSLHNKPPSTVIKRSQIEDMSGPGNPMSPLAEEFQNTNAILSFNAPSYEVQIASSEMEQIIEGKRVGKLADDVNAIGTKKRMVAFDGPEPKEEMPVVVDSFFGHSNLEAFESNARKAQKDIATAVLYTAIRMLFYPLIPLYGQIFNLLSDILPILRPAFFTNNVYVVCYIASYIATSSQGLVCAIVFFTADPTYRNIYFELFPEIRKKMYKRFRKFQKAKQHRRSEAGSAGVKGINNSSGSSQDKKNKKGSNATSASALPQVVGLGGGAAGAGPSRQASKETNSSKQSLGKDKNSKNV